jgi:hypothetical protein
MKNICPIHRYTYTTRECPFCKKEREERIKQLYAEEIEAYEKSQQITNDDIARLAEKFNVQIGKK